mgnify:CR=1 FL=1
MRSKHRRLLAIAVDDQRLSYVSMAARWKRWRQESPGGNLPAAQVLPSGGVGALGELLRRIPVQKMRRLCVGLPRRLFFLRDVPLPPMLLEDAYQVVHNGLSLYCHLPLDSIYADVRIRRCADKSLEALVLYAPKEAIHAVLHELSETGHREELYALFPVSLGWGAWLHRAGVDLPAGLVMDGETEKEVVVTTSDGRLRSFLLDTHDLSVSRFFEESVSLIGGIAVPRERLFRESEVASALSVKNPPWSLPWPWDNAAALVAAAVLDGTYDFCPDGRAPRMHLFHPAKVVVPLAAALAGAALFLSWQGSVRHAALQDKIRQARERIRVLEGRLIPMEKSREEIRRLQTLVAGASGFMERRPRFYSFLNDIAQRVPSGTWLSQFNYQEKQFVVQCVTPDALKAIEAFRKSPFVESAQVRGSVTRRSDGYETFALAIELK